MVTGIMSAMDEEIGKLVSALDPLEEEIAEGGRIYYKGKLWGKQVVLVFSRWGKVAAATSVTSLIAKYKVDQVIFTGVAGSVNKNIKVGDIVVSNYLHQHDMDARPFFERFEIPLLNVSKFSSDSNLVRRAKEAAIRFISEEIQSMVSQDVLNEFKIMAPQVLEGHIASGDRFFNSKKEVNNLNKCLPEVLCVEMEGAAVAQVCYEYGIPFVVIRTISDSADEHSHVDFAKFTRLIANNYSYGILKNILS
jgi:adenosylhomocysteine nucleosidase